MEVAMVEKKEEPEKVGAEMVQVSMEMVVGVVMVHLGEMVVKVETTEVVRTVVLVEVGKKAEVQTAEKSAEKVRVVAEEKVLVITEMVVVVEMVMVDLVPV